MPLLLISRYISAVSTYDIVYEKQCKTQKGQAIN